jgi:hypothetical protein
MTKRNIFLSLLVVLMVALLAGVTFAQDAWNGGRMDGPVVIKQPTAQGTATPGVIIDSDGLGVILDVRDANTPVLTVYNGGTVNGKALRYATAGSQIICGIQTITDTATITTGLAQSTYCLAQLNATAIGDARSASCTAGTTTVVVTVRNSALTPAANGTGASVTWCAIGTP